MSRTSPSDWRNFAISGKSPRERPSAHAELVVQSVEKCALLLLLPKVWHLLPQKMNDVAVDLQVAAALRQLVNSAQHRVARERIEFLQKVELFSVQQVRLFAVLKGTLPKRAEVNAADLGRAHHLAQLPHERTINAQQLLGINGVRLIQKYPDLVVVRSQHVDRVFELIGDVELVRVEHYNDHVGALCEPAKQRSV